MKVLIQVGNLGYNIVNHLLTPIPKASNINNVVIVCTNPGPENPKIKYICPPKIIKRYSLLAFFYESFALLLYSILRGPDILTGYLLFPHGLLAYIVARITGKPLILCIIAGPVELYSIGSPRNFDYTKPLNLYGKFMLNILKHTNAIITTGSFTKQFLVGHDITPSKIYPVISVPNKSVFHPQPIKKMYDVISVGRLSLVKHHEVLLYAINEIKKEYPGIKVCIVGDGRRKPELIQLSEKLGLSSNIDFVGHQKDVARYYNMSRIFVHTSKREGFPNVFLEAQLCGLPSVVSNCGDIIDIAKDGVNAFVIDKYDDYTSFANAIRRLLEDQELYETMAHNALDVAGALTPETTTKTWEKIIKEINIA